MSVLALNWSSEIFFNVANKIVKRIFILCENLRSAQTHDPAPFLEKSRIKSSIKICELIFFDVPLQASPITSLESTKKTLQHLQFSIETAKTATTLCLLSYLSDIKKIEVKSQNPKLFQYRINQRWTRKLSAWDKEKSLFSSWQRKEGAVVMVKNRRTNV